METTQAEMETMGTKPQKEHEWLKNLLGNWTFTSEMMMPEGETITSDGTETVTSLGGLWSHAETRGMMPDGSEMLSYMVLGYDVSFKEYRGAFFASMSSHLWKYAGKLDASGKVMTLECEGPDMVHDGQTALYRDVIELLDGNTRTLTSYGQDDQGEWQILMKATFTRAS